MLDFSECHCRNNMVDRITATRSTSCPFLHERNVTPLWKRVMVSCSTWPPLLCLRASSQDRRIAEKTRRGIRQKDSKATVFHLLHHADETPYEFVDPQSWKNSLLINASRCKIREVNFTGDSGNKGMSKVHPNAHSLLSMPTLNPKHRSSN